MEEFFDEKEINFFAAANTYGGFVSYFDRVFPSEEFEKIYVLKGGPGTGKSSFMKAIAKEFEGKNFKIERIYCSSDPHSLDGAIITRNNKKVAILDGTAPHERDAIIPGAIDEIINLGDSWDKGWLKANRQNILSKASRKSECYKTAYRYLKIAGAANEFIKSVHLECFDKSTAKSKAECILQDIPTCKSGRIFTRLVSSFGRQGEYRLNTLSTLSSRQIKVFGERENSMLFLQICMDILKGREMNILHLPDALDTGATDAIYLPDFRLAITRNGDGDINADDFFNISPTELDRIKKAKETRGVALNEAKRWFAIASDIHFSLEEIYGQAMNFHKNELLINEKSREIGIILENEI